MNKSFFKLLILGFTLFLAVGLLLTMLYGDLPSYANDFLGRGFYWLFFFLVVELIIFFKLKSKILLFIALAITLIGSVFSIFKIDNIAEGVLSVGFVFWLVGAAQQLLELKRNENKKYS